MRRLVAPFAAAVVAAVLVSVAPADAAPTVRRVGGVDRYETAALLAADVAAPVEVVHLASGEAFPDALAAAPAGGPVLLVTRSDVPGVTAEALARLQPKRVVVLAGTEAVDPAVVTRAQEIVPSAQLERVGGEDRYGTAALLAARNPGTGSVFVASGEGFQDPLVASAAAAAEGAPLLLVAGASVPTATGEALTKLPSPRQIVVVASAGSLGPGVADELRRYGTVTTIGGSTPYETSAQLAGRRSGATTGYLASGLTYPDALAGAAAAGARKAPLLLVRGSCLTPQVAQQVDRLSTVTVLGGELALTKSAAALTTCGPAPAPGQWESGEISTAWVDTTRRTVRPGVIDEPHRSLPVLVVFPAHAAGTNEPAMGHGPFPMLTVSHGLGSDPANLYDEARSMARRGYVVVVPTFPLTNDRSPGGPYTGDLLNQAGDLSFLVTSALEESGRGTAPLGGMVDPARIGAFGVSFGGITSLTLLNSCCVDGRFKAVMSVIGHFPSQVPTPWVYDIGMPLLMLNTTHDPLIPYAEARQGWEKAVAPKFMVTFPSDRHDIPRALGENVARATTGFFDRYVKGDVNALETLLRSFDGVDPAAATFDRVP
jgi:putative cell wall-binding protein/dienelactone hydrolase